MQRKITFAILRWSSKNMLRQLHKGKSLLENKNPSVKKREKSFAQTRE